MTIHIPFWMLPSLVLAVLGTGWLVASVRYRGSGMYDFGGGILGFLGVVCWLGAILWFVAYKLGAAS